jgi:hypothetical protein
MHNSKLCRVAAKMRPKVEPKPQRIHVNRHASLENRRSYDELLRCRGKDVPF